MASLEDDFVKLEDQILMCLEEYKGLCERLGFDFTDHIEDLVEQVRNPY